MLKKSMPMIVGLSIMLKASHKIKRIMIRLFKKTGTANGFGIKAVNSAAASFLKPRKGA